MTNQTYIKTIKSLKTFINTACIVGGLLLAFHPTSPIHLNFIGLCFVFYGIIKFALLEKEIEHEKDKLL